MFARKACYLFVRPFLGVCVFLGRKIKDSQVRRVDRISKSKLVHNFRITQRDEVEAPVTDWLREAYEVSEALSKGDATLITKTKPGNHPARAGSRTEVDFPLLIPSTSSNAVSQELRRTFTSTRTRVPLKSSH
jgi:hypothetical protein